MSGSCTHSNELPSSTAWCRSFNNSANTKFPITLLYSVHYKFIKQCWIFIKEIMLHLYAFFWVLHRRLNFISQHFLTPCLFHLHRQLGLRMLGYSQPQLFFTPSCLWRWNRQSVTKCWHIKFRHRGITQKKAYNIQNTAKVWNQECVTFIKFLPSSKEFWVIIRKHAYQCQSNSFLKFPQHPLFEYASVHTQYMVATSEWHIFHDPSSTYKKQFQE
jgi:hypothetical protein